MSRISFPTRRIYPVALTLLAAACLTGCEGYELCCKDIDLQTGQCLAYEICPPSEYHPLSNLILHFTSTLERGQLAELGTASRGIEGGSITALAAVADLACAPPGFEGLLPPNAVFGTSPGTSAALSDGIAKAYGPSWLLLTPSLIGLSGTRVLTSRCHAGKFLAGTDKGLEWISLNDRSTGIFSAPSWGLGATAIAPVDSGHVLTGVAPPPGAAAGFARLLLCDVAANSCAPSATGIPDASVTAEAIVGVTSTGGSHLVAVLARGGIFGSANGGQAWTKASGLPVSLTTYNGLAGSGNTVFVSTNAGLYKMGASETTWSFSGPNVSGSPLATSAVALQGSTVYASQLGSTTIHKSTNGGGSWSPTGAGIPANVNALAITPNYLWAATTAGVYRSADGGSTWDAFNAGLNNAQISKVVASGGSAYAVTNNGSGVFRSTDNCVSWASSSPSLVGKAFLTIATAGNSILFAGSGGLYRSTDGGATVTAISLPRTYLALAAVGSNFLAVTTGPPLALYRSTDSGSSWATYGSGFPTTGSGFAPVLAANGNSVVVAVGATVSRSLDGGATWTTGSAVPGVTYFSGLAFAGNTLWAAAPFGAATGLYRSDDLGVTWTRPADGPTQARDIAVSGSRLLAGTTDGTFTSTDSGATWSRFHDELKGVDVYSVAVSSGIACVGTLSNSVLALPFAATVRRLVPIVLDVDTGAAHYTTELSLTNRGTSDAQITLVYTASLGTGSGTVNDVLHAGAQLVLPDVVGYLRGKGLSIPTGGSQGGTLLVTFDNLSDSNVASAVARTTSATGAPQPVGAAGLAYTAVDPDLGSRGSLTVYGLRSSSTDRSNLAVYNTTADPVTFGVTAFSGDGTGASAVVTAGETLPGWGWRQYNRILDGVGLTNGWVTVTRTSTTGAFGTYGVVNDNVTNDGSFIVSAPADARPLFLNVPVLVETGAFVSELVLTNAAPQPADFVMSYDESRSSPSSGTRSILVTIPPFTQRIIPGAIDWLRSMNIAIGPPGSAVGSFNVYVSSGGGIGRFFAGARTASPSSAGGQYGLFTGPAFAGDEATSVAYIYGLHADAGNRSNAAGVNTAQDAASGPITLSFEVFDGDAGGAPHGPYPLTLAPGQWGQIGGILGNAGVSNGWVRVTRTSGTAPWIAYGVVNDGGAPGQRTGDGAFVPMEKP